MDLFQTSRVGTTEPQSLRKHDRIKRRFEEDRGYLSDDGKVSVPHSSLQASKTDTNPVLPPRALHASHSSHASPTQHLSSSPHPSPVITHPSPSSGPTIPSEKPKKILFYHANDPYYGFTNFSSDPIQYNGKTYPTSEHLFQSMKVRFSGR